MGNHFKSWCHYWQVWYQRVCASWPHACQRKVAGSCSQVSGSTRPLSFFNITLSSTVSFGSVHEMAKAHIVAAERGRLGLNNVFAEKSMLNPFSGRNYNLCGQSLPLADMVKYRQVYLNVFCCLFWVFSGECLGVNGDLPVLPNVFVLALGVVNDVLSLFTNKPPDVSSTWVSFKVDFFSCRWKLRWKSVRVPKDALPSVLLLNWTTPLKLTWSSWCAKACYGWKNKIKFEKKGEIFEQICNWKLHAGFFLETSFCFSTCLYAMTFGFFFIFVFLCVLAVEDVDYFPVSQYRKDRALSRFQKGIKVPIFLKVKKERSRIWIKL